MRIFWKRFVSVCCVLTLLMSSLSSNAEVFGIEDWFGDHLEDAAATVGGIKDFIGEKASSAGEMIGDAAKSAGTWAGETFSAAGDWFSSGASDVKEKLGDFAEWAIDGVAQGFNTGKRYIENFDTSKFLDKEYYIQSITKLFLGGYSDENGTELSAGLNIAASVLNIDAPLDMRDLVYDVQHISDGSVGAVELGIDVISVVPLIGAIKPIKKLKDAAKAIDTAADVADAVTDMTKSADNVSDAVKDAERTADTVDALKDAEKASDEITDSAKSTSKAADAIDDAAETVKQVSKKKLPKDVQKELKKYIEDGWKGILPDAADGTSAGKAFNNREGFLPKVDAQGNYISYREFDALPFGMDSEYPNSRGVKRFIVGSNGDIFYTDDHYMSFVQIIN